jgi:hypothetical protein
VKKISVELVNSKISEYLGDFIVDSPLFDDRFWNNITILLESPSLTEALLESLKQDMLHFYTAMKKDYPNQSDITISDEYFHSLVEKTDHIDNILLKDVIEDLRKYISQIHDFKKPEHIIDLIDTTRTLPDFGQKINIAEIQTKKRLLIADEMGL